MVQVKKALLAIVGTVLGIVTLRAIRKRRSGSNPGPEIETAEPEDETHEKAETAAEHAKAAATHARLAAEKAKEK